MPRRRSVRITRREISPRLAIRTLSNTARDPTEVSGLHTAHRFRGARTAQRSRDCVNTVTTARRRRRVLPSAKAERAAHAFRCRYDAEWHPTVREARVAD